MLRATFLFLIYCLGMCTPSWGQMPGSDSTSIPEEQIALEVSFYPPRLNRVGESSTIGVEVKGLEALNSVWIQIEGEVAQQVSLVAGKGEFSLSVPTSGKIAVAVAGQVEEVELRVVSFPLWMSLLPPLLAILLALLTREVVVSLFLGIFVGAGILGWYSKGAWVGLGSGFLAVIDTYLKNALTDGDHIAILLFSLLIGGMVAIISRNGGMQAIVNVIAKYAKSPRSGQLATWLLGLVIFFDDYANTLVVGNTMRPVTDKLRISREKLAYLVDSTAAPVAALAFITTWIGAELGYIEDGISQLQNFPAGQSPYRIFLGSLSYSFYPILTLLFMLLLIFSGRDFGPMRKAEAAARNRTAPGTSGESDTKIAEDVAHFQAKSDIPIRLLNSLLPILVLVFGVLIGLLYTGYDAVVWADPELGFLSKLSQIIGNADSYAALLWASLSALGVAILLSVSQRILSLAESMSSMVNGFNAMMSALIILALAWGLQGVTDDLATADYLIDLLGQNLWPYWLPAITFLLAGLVSFSTGSSWGTMAILYPLIIPLCWETCLVHELPVEDALPILYNVVACVLAGSVLGDHCSPISDTTILSSLASGANHLAHVRTQLPYALTVGGVAIVFGTLPAAFGVPTWICFVLSLSALYGVVRFLGKIVE